LICQLEQGSGIRRPSPSLQRIARAFDVDLSTLLAKPASMPSGNPKSGVVAIREALTSIDVMIGRDLMKLHRQLPGFVAWSVPGDVKSGQWRGVAEVLEAIAERCRRVDVVVEPPQPRGPVPGTFSASGPGL
jgi:hypothetical protein